MIQTGTPRDLYNRPANDFVLSFLGPVTRLVGGRLVRPHDLEIRLDPDAHTFEAMISRMVYLGFEVRFEVALSDGATTTVQVAREQVGRDELAVGRTIFIRQARRKTIALVENY